MKPIIASMVLAITTFTTQAMAAPKHVELRVSFDILQTVADCGVTVDECPDVTWSAIRKVTQLLTPTGSHNVYEVIVDPSAPPQSVRLYLDGRRTNNVADESRAVGIFFYTMGRYMGMSDMVNSEVR